MDPAEDPNIDPEKVDAWLAPDKEWARLETSLSVTRVFNPRGDFRPYLQGRVGIERIHPRSELFYVQPPPEDLEPGDSPTEATNGIGFTIQPGFEIALGRTLSLDSRGTKTGRKTGSYDMSPLGLPDVDSATRGRARLAAVHGDAGSDPKAVFVDLTRKPLPSPADGVATPGRAARVGHRRDVRDQLGRLDDQQYGNANFNQMSLRLLEATRSASLTTTTSSRPTSWSTLQRDLLQRGARNGSFWGSSAMAIAGASSGSLGETHPMSFNDMISTGIGGIARGEVMHRISSLILDNTKRGKTRFGQEAAALLMNPIRGFNRAVSGDWSEVKGNPVHPYDWRPTLQMAVRAGGRVIGEGESISENTNSYGFFEWTLNYGDAWDPDNRRPYDRFDVVTQSNFGDKTRVGRLLIRGDLVSKLVGANHSLALQQDFDYIDNEAYGTAARAWGRRSCALRAVADDRAADARPGVLHPARGRQL
jgi:hypothetical protein